MPYKDPEDHLRWHREHPEGARSRTNRWRERNRTKYLAACRFARHVRRIRAIAAVGSWTLAQWDFLKAAFDNRCVKCGLADSELKERGRVLSPDHVRPLAKGGTNNISNIQPLCHGKGGCNNRKYTKWIDYRGGFVLEIL